MFKLWTDTDLCAEAKALLGEQVQFIGLAVYPDSADRLIDVEQADAAIVRTSFPGVEDTFQRAANLKVIARTGIGYDTIDVDAATKHGICVTNAPDAPTQAVAEFTFALILNVARRVSLGDRQLRAGIWKPLPTLVGMELYGKTLGLVGFGRTGSRVAAIARVFGMMVLAYDPYVADYTAYRDVTFVESLGLLLQSAHVVSLHIPLTAQTRGLIGRAQLAMMKPGAILINVARGPVVDEEALLAALQSGHLSGAGIDVWGQEPLPSISPLMQVDRTVGSPHMAGTTAESMVRAQTAAAEAALLVLRGERPPTLVNPAVWDHRR